MINKILAYFPNSVTRDFPPTSHSDEFYWFKEHDDDNIWVGIPKSDLPSGQLELLSVLFHFAKEEKSPGLTGAAQTWHQFLFHDGQIPLAQTREVRFIQFQFHAKEIDREEISEALQGFFSDHIIIWLQESYGLLVEERKEVSVTAEELASISSTFESDFFIKLSFYIGKYNKIDIKLRESLTIERQLFMKAVNHTNRDNVYTFEKIFPLLLASSMPAELKAILESSVLEAFEEDRELMSTIKVFLESNSNASLAAKKLYVHRNTLQYRMDKFMEKTGIHLKDFDSSVMVYLACLYEEMR